MQEALKAELARMKKENQELKDKINGWYAKAEWWMALRRARVPISFVKENHSPRPGIKSKRSEQFFINIASSDAERMRIMHDLGATPIQSTFLI